MKKRIMATWMALILALTLLPAAALAANVVATADDLNAAVTGAADATVIQLSNDITLGETLTIPAGKDITLDLNGHALSISATTGGVSNYGTLTIQDSSAVGDSHGIGNGRLYTTDVAAQGRHAMINYGTLTINSGIFGDKSTVQDDANDVQRGNALRNYGTAVINGGAFTCCDNYTGPGDGYAYVIANGGSSAYPNASLTINYATVYGKANGLLAADGGVLTVKDGVYTLGSGTEKNLWRMVYTSGDGRVDIQGGNYTRNADNNYGFFGGSVTVSGGTFQDTHNNAIFVDFGTVTIFDGTFEDKLTAGASSSVILSGGDFKDGVDTGNPAIIPQDGYQFSGSGSDFTVIPGGTRIFASGAGTVIVPYIIEDIGQLEAFRGSVNSGKTYAGQFVTLTSSLTLPSTSWDPIGNGTKNDSSYTGAAFKGTFNGGGNTISGLTISGSTSNEDNAIGLFGVVSGGTVENFTLEDVNINVTGGECVGGAVGLMVDGSVVRDVAVNGSLTAVRGLGGIVGRMTVSGLIENCVNNATVAGTSTGSGNVGGIVGAAYYTDEDVEMYIVNCQNHGAISNNKLGVGGIAGLSAANVWGCYNDGTVTGAGASIGGIVGEQQNAGSISDCTNTANVTSNGNGADYGTGGIVGWVRYNGELTPGSYLRHEIIEISNNLNTGSVTSTVASAGGIVGHLHNAGVVTGNENRADTISSVNFAAGIVGSIQNDDGYYEVAPYVDVYNNVSTTPLSSIYVKCIDLYADNNFKSDPAYSVTDSAPFWQAKIGDTKYASLATAISAAQSGETVELLEDVTVDTWTQLWHVKGITLDGNGKTLKVNAIESLENHDALIQSDGGNTFRNITFDLSGITEPSKAQGYKAVSAANGDVFNGVKVIGSTNPDVGVYGIFAGGSDAANETITITNCTFENCAYAIGSQPTSGTTTSTLENLVVTGSTFTNCDYAGILYTENTTFTGNTVDSGKLNIMHEDQIVTGNTFTDGSRIKFYENPSAFEKNIISADSYLDASDSVSAVDVSGNYWGGGAPSSTQIPASITGKITGTEIYYTAPTMRPEDMNNYVPPVLPGYAIAVKTDGNGTVTVSPSRAEAGQAVTIIATPTPPSP